MKQIKHTWYYKVTKNGKVEFKKVTMTRPALFGKRTMMASVNSQEINELKQKERNMDLTIITKAEYDAATKKQEVTE